MIVSVIIALTIAATLFTPISDTVTGNTGVQTVENGTVTASNSSYVELNGYNIQKDSETVEWYNSTSSSYETVDEGTDYDMAYENGSIIALDGGTISDGDELRVSYDYKATDDSTTTVVTLVPMFVALLMLGVLASKVQGAL
jgi:hypothetical protein